MPDPLTPQITLTATLEDITGEDAGTTANPARLLIKLCNFGLTLPQIPGTATLAKISIEEESTGNEISVTLWGNDVINPAMETYYRIMVMDGEGNIVQSACYQFTGTQAIDLSEAAPISPPPSPPIVLPNIQYLPCAPVPPQATGVIYVAPGPICAVFYNGIAQRKGTDWHVVTANSFTLTFPTFNGETVYALCVVS